MKELDRWLLNPIPRGATYRKWDDFYLSPRILYAHQLFYVFSGTGEGMVNGEHFQLEPGLLVVYGPGCTHEFSSIQRGGLEMGMICFSLNETDEAKRALGNRYVTSIDDEYWKMADEPVHISGLPPFPFHIKLGKMSWRPDFENALRENGDAWRRHFSNPLVYKVKSILADLFFHIEQELAKESDSNIPPILFQILDYVSASYSLNINRKNLAQRFHISESYLTALLLKHKNTNFSELLEQTRLRAALELLQYSELNAKQIASEVGFNSLSYFITRFRKKYGITPGNMR